MKSHMIRLYLLCLVIGEVHTGQLHAIKKAAGLCRALYPLCQIKMPGNILQNVLRKAEQVHPLHERKFHQQYPAPACSLPWCLPLMPGM